MFKARSDASYTWRGILENVKLPRPGSKVEVGNGRQTLFWHDNWLGKGPFCNIVTEPVPPTIAECKVADMRGENRGWKWEAFADRIPPDFRKLIASQSLRCGDEYEYQIIWNDSS